MCYFAWQEDILNKAEWTIYLRNLEGRRRYRISDMTKNNINYIHLGDDFDLAMIDGNFKLVSTFREEN